jgi:hypothetical protein
MPDKADITLDAGTDSTDPVVCQIHCNPELVGHDAEFQLVAEVDVQDKRPVNKEVTLYRQKFTVVPGVKTIKIPRMKFRAYSYSDKNIEINIHTRLKVDDAIFFDTKISQEQQIKIGTKPYVREDAKDKIEPNDIFKFFENLKAIPVQNQLITLFLVVVGGLIMLINAAIGIHDQFVPESMTYLYSHVNSEGESQSPLAGSLMMSGVLGVAVWFAMRNQLRKYMKFNLNLINMPANIYPDKTYKVSKFFSGRSRVPLEDITLRIVACNMEKGQYVRGSGSNQRTVSFSEPVRGVLLYEKCVNHIPNRVQIRNYFDEEISFKSMFEILYPPYMASPTHGIDVYWEIQLLHPEFVDQELIAPTKHFRYEDFLVS